MFLSVLTNAILFMYCIMSFCFLTTKPRDSWENVWKWPVVSWMGHNSVIVLIFKLDVVTENWQVTKYKVERPHRRTVYRCIDTDRWAWSVGLSVTVVSHAKTAESIEMPFGLWTRVGPRNHVLDGGADASVGRGPFRECLAHCKA